MFKLRLLKSLLLLVFALPGYSFGSEFFYTANLTGINQKGEQINVASKVSTLSLCERELKNPIIRPTDKFLKISGACTRKGETEKELSVVCINFVKTPRDKLDIALNEMPIKDEDIVGSKCTKSFNSSLTYEYLEKVLSEESDIPGWHNLFK